MDDLDGGPNYYGGGDQDLGGTMYYGKIRSFSQQKGYGFIECPDTYQMFERDVFIHKNQMGGLAVDQDVIFDVHLNKSGHPQARNVYAAEPGDETSMGVGASPPTLDMGIGYQDADLGPGPDGAFGLDMSLNLAPGSELGQGALGMPCFGGGCGGLNAHLDGMNRPLGSLLGGMEPPLADSRGLIQGGGIIGANLPEIEEMLRACSCSADIVNIMFKYGTSFGRQHCVAALYQLALCSKYDVRALDDGTLPKLLIERMHVVPPAEFTIEEATRLVWAISVLDNLRHHMAAHTVAMRLAREASRRYMQYSPTQMATLLGAMLKLVVHEEDVALVASITDNYNDFALGGGKLPRFPDMELRAWLSFLKETAGMPSMQRPSRAMDLRGMGPPEPTDLFGLPRGGCGGGGGGLVGGLLGRPGRPLSSPSAPPPLGGSGLGQDLGITDNFFAPPAELQRGAGFRNVIGGLLAGRAAAPPSRPSAGGASSSFSLGIHDPPPPRGNLLGGKMIGGGGGLRDVQPQSGMDFLRSAAALRQTQNGKGHGKDGLGAPPPGTFLRGARDHGPTPPLPRGFGVTESMAPPSKGGSGKGRDPAGLSAKGGGKYGGQKGGGDKAAAGGGAGRGKSGGYGGGGKQPGHGGKGDGGGKKGSESKAAGGKGSAGPSGGKGGKANRPPPLAVGLQSASPAAAK
eukprot:TRINITY_DN7495_c0_g1_i1.p1 TRINITY_DN7495_c0_g1~~TRINITY_DN7495_c0_g1_i1.p1  ORF type:complete len:685 (-),score=154.04 TRINITY_DN7495_c0_g1_i1:296-2350(-)